MEQGTGLRIVKVETVVDYELLHRISQEEISYLRREVAGKERWAQKLRSRVKLMRGLFKSGRTSFCDVCSPVFIVIEPSDEILPESDRLVYRAMLQFAPPVADEIFAEI